MTAGDRSIELRRQRLLLQTLWQRLPDSAVSGWLRDDPARAAEGLSAYRGNAAATTRRALAAAYPVLAELVGDECFDSLAAQCWQGHPPVLGDLGRYGEQLMDLVQAWIDDPQKLADEPYLADVARLEWQVHLCDSAADAHDAVVGLGHLEGPCAERATLVLRPGTAVLGSRWPVVSVWQAHQPAEARAFVAVRRAFAQGRAESARIWRDAHWRTRVDLIEPADEAFTRAVQAGRPLGVALDLAIEADGTFDFGAWLVRALQQQWLVEVRPATESNHGDEG